MTNVWYDAPETFEERQARTDRFGFATDPRTLPFSRLLDRAYGMVRPHMRRAPRGIAMPFGLEHRAYFIWRLSPDVRHVLLREWPTDYAAPSTAPGEALFGVRIEVDSTAPEGTLELLDAANDAASPGREGHNRG